MSETISIGELSARSCIAISAIRYYERIGLLSPASRVSGRRRYAPDAVVSLSLIRLGQQVGFTLTELLALRRADGGGPGDPQWATLLGQKFESNAAAMERLREAQRLLAAALACGCQDLVTCARRDAHS